MENIEKDLKNQVKGKTINNMKEKVNVDVSTSNLVDKESEINGDKGHLVSDETGEMMVDGIESSKDENVLNKGSTKFHNDT